MPATQRRLRPQDHSILAYANNVLALVIDIGWANTSMSLILSEVDEARRNDLLNLWLTHRLADLDRISLTVCQIVQES
jgi:hypothetical protein